MDLNNMGVGLIVVAIFMFIKALLLTKFGAVDIFWFKIIPFVCGLFLLISGLSLLGLFN